MFLKDMFVSHLFGRGAAKMKQWNRKMIVGLVSILFMMMMPFHLTNAYLHSSDFDTVIIKHDDSVWELAHRYTNDEKQAAELQQAIIDVNGLQPDGSGLIAGQNIQVPVLKRSAGNELAEK